MIKRLIIIGIIILLITLTFSGCFEEEKQIKDKKVTKPVDSYSFYVDDDSPLEWYNKTNFNRIQDAIDAANNNDSIFVFTGIYYENIIINKSITLQGEDKNITIIDGSKKDYLDVVSILADRITLSSFTLQNSGDEYYPNYDSGIDLCSNNITITNNIIFNNSEGIYLHSAEEINLSENIFLNNHNCIRIRDNCNKINMINNNISNNEDYCIQILNSNNNSIIDNMFLHNYRAIDADTSSNNIILGNTISYNKDGIRFDNCSNNKITDNVFNHINYTGIDLLSSSNNNTIYDNIIDSDIGISGSKNNKIYKNNLEAITIAHSRDNHISDNTFNNGGLYIYHSLYQSNEIVDNTVNNKPLVYLEGKSDKIIDYDVGQILLLRCNNITIQNRNLSNTYVGIELLETTNCLISGNIISNNRYGMDIADSSIDNKILNNYISNSRWDGIQLRWYANNNTIMNNTISNCDDGIYLTQSCNNNVITSNNILNNYNGIHIYKGLTFGDPSEDYDTFFVHSNYNLIYHNNFINNSQNAKDGCNNTWHNTTTNEGNYWSDYTEKYPNVTQTNGIWNTPYNISQGDNQDKYPLVSLNATTVITDKIEYLHGETITITVDNHVGRICYMHYEGDACWRLPFGVEHFLEDENKWENVSVGLYTDCDDEDGYVIIKCSDTPIIFNWDQLDISSLENVISGKYRIKFYEILGNEGKEIGLWNIDEIKPIQLTIYSNEFTIN